MLKSLRCHLKRTCRKSSQFNEFSFTVVLAFNGVVGREDEADLSDSIEDASVDSFRSQVSCTTGPAATHSTSTLDSKLIDSEFGLASSSAVSSPSSIGSFVILAASGVKSEASSPKKWLHRFMKPGRCKAVASLSYFSLDCCHPCRTDRIS